MTSGCFSHERWGGFWNPARTAGLVLLTALVWPAGAQNVASVSGTNSLRMPQFLQKVLERNESIQLRVLELEIARRRYNGEQGAFEPDFMMGASQEGNK